MKKAVLFVIILCLCFNAFGGAAFAETVAEEAPAEGMTGEELYQIAKAAAEAYDYEKALKYYQLAADAGSADGWRGLGVMYMNGNGVEADMEKGLEYTQVAVGMNDAKAFANLGLFYHYGLGAVEQDIGRAAECYEKSGELGYSGAFVTLGNLYQYGEGVEQDIGKAAE